MRIGNGKREIGRKKEREKRREKVCYFIIEPGH